MPMDYELPETLILTKHYIGRYLPTDDSVKLVIAFCRVSAIPNYVLVILILSSFYLVS